ncbi:GumC family protein [Telluria sp. Tellsp104]
MTKLSRATREQLDELNEEISVIDVIVVLSKYRKLIVGLPVAIAVLTALISLLVPDVYKASTKLLPPQQAQSSATALLSQLTGMAGGAAGVPGLKSPGDLYVGMLESRTIADKLIAKFNLKKAYDTDSQEVARKKLNDNTDIASGKDGFITIDVEDRNKAVVAPLANAYADELLQLTKVLAVTEASQRRLFYERELERAKNNLAEAEAKLKNRFDTHGVISVEGESRAAVETVGRLRAQVSAKEIQLNSMRAFVTPNNPDFRQVEQELSSLKAELSKLENGSGQTGQSSSSKESGQSGLESVKLLRDVKYFEMLYGLLAKQYEIARLDEAKDPATIQVLDPAVEPEKKFKPKRTLIVILSGFIGGVIAIVMAFVLDAKTRAKKIIKSRQDELA